MSGGGENQELTTMKKLLTSWKVGMLVKLFKEEDITIKELKMIQLNHIYDLLKNQKMGVRIRFEHHLKIWRNKIGIPLKSTEFAHHHASCSNYIENCVLEESPKSNQNTIINNSINEGRKRRRLNKTVTAMDNAELSEDQPLLSPQSPNSNSSLVSASEYIICKPDSILESPNEKSHNTGDEEEMENFINPLADILMDCTDQTPPKFPSKPTSEKSPFSLQQILETSGVRGMSIVKFFNDKQRLTDIHRTQLIQTIVDFFLLNDYHLSLNMSHILEWEILKMFPTERLEYYRTEKRGKIYVKFSNTKRIKRERTLKLKAELESGTRCTRRSLGTINSECDMEDWYAEPEILVKEENEIGGEQYFAKD